MELELRRLPSGAVCTHGDLYVDGVWECFTLEDPVREKKVWGETAIPAGRYLITLEESPRFGADTLTVNNVPDFTGVRIHAGNTARDTHGCPLVGRVRQQVTIGESRVALAALKAKVAEAIDAGEYVWLTITNAGG